MEVRIGIQNALREVTFESKSDQEALAKEVNDVLTKGGILSLTDDKGRVHIVPAATVAYVELGESGERRVGFGT